MPTLDLEDGDIVGIAVAPIVMTPSIKKTSAPPPPPAMKKSSAPPAPKLQSSVPPAPASKVAPISRIPVPMNAKHGTPGLAFKPAPVPSFKQAPAPSSFEIDVEIPPPSNRAPVVGQPSYIPPPMSAKPASIAPPPAPVVTKPVSIAPPPAPVAKPTSVAPPAQKPSHAHPAVDRSHLSWTAGKAITHSVTHPAPKAVSIAPPSAKPVSIAPPPVAQAPVSIAPAPVSMAPVSMAPVSMGPQSIAPPSYIPPAPIAVEAAPVFPPPARVPVMAAPAPAPAPAAPTPIAAAKRQTAPSVSKMRLSISDPTDLIFDGMYGLTFARSAGEAAEMCAETLAKALGARTVVIHTHDLLSRELRAIGAHGDGDFDIIRSREASEDDLVASAVICNQKSVTMKFDGELPQIAPKRLHAIGTPRTVVAAPAMAWGRCLAIIEVIDADERYAGHVAESAAYVANHFAQYLSENASAA